MQGNHVSKHFYLLTFLNRCIKMIEELLSILVANEDIQTGENIAEESEFLSVSLPTVKKLIFINFYFFKLGCTI